MFQTGESQNRSRTAECGGYRRERGTAAVNKNRALEFGRRTIGSPTRIRTSIHGVKGRCPTIRRSGNVQRATPLLYPNRVSRCSRYNRGRKPILAGAGHGLQTRCAVRKYRGWVRHPLASAKLPLSAPVASSEQRIAPSQTQSDRSCQPSETAADNYLCFAG